MGADALEMLLGRTQLDQLSYDLRHQAATDTSQQRKAEALKRLKVVEAFRDARTRIENKPEWMVIKWFLLFHRSCVHLFRWMVAVSLLPI